VPTDVRGRERSPRFPPITYGDYLDWWTDANYSVSRHADAQPGQTAATR
jgi:hypothetical protein